MHRKKNNQRIDNLIIGYLNDELAVDETRDLIEWIKTDSNNKRYFDEYCEIWVTAKVTLKNPEYNVQKGFWEFKKRIRDNEELSSGSRIVSLFKLIPRYAAICIITFSLSGFLFYYLGKNQVEYPVQSISELTVPMGSHAQFTLSDGTVVTLNAGSRLNFDNHFGLEDRIVKLEGEGYFEVAKDDKRPFVVMTSHLNIKALGTEFNVKAYSDEKTIETTLVEGSVEIEQVTSAKKAKEIVLKPSQKFTFIKKDSNILEDTTTPKIRIKDNPQPLPEPEPETVTELFTENVNVESIISWKEDIWIFEKQSLAQIAVDLERKFDIQICFDSERLQSFRFTGTILSEPIEQVLEVMSISAPISFKLKGRVVTLSENRKFEELTKHLYNQQ